MSHDLQDLVAKDLPSLQDLLSVLSAEGQLLDEIISNLLKKVECGELSVDNGISLLDVKYHSLLSYIIDLVLLTRMKVGGISIANCKAKHRLIENRTVLEKINPLEHKIKYQVDKLVQQSSRDVQNDPLSLKPRLEELENKLNDHSGSENEDAGNEPKKYVPPRIASSHYDFEENDRDMRIQQARQKALKKSSVIMDLAQETSDAPLEISEHSSGRKKVQKERAERTKYEESNLMRINVTKKQKNLEKQMLRRSELNGITNFGDISILEEDFLKTKPQKRKSGAKYKAGKKWKRFRK